MQQPSPLQESDIIFPSASTELRDALSKLRRTNLSIKNRLKSIEQDAEFVTSVADAYQLPLVANERCGSWYISPEKKAGSAYFKSTDGHFGQWSFSLRRLNLQVLDVIQRFGGCIIVDSTRRGKSMPDALSKTVPIWVTTLNRLLFPDHEDTYELSTPLDVVSESEHVQIEARLAGCLRSIQKLALNVEDLKAKINHMPLKVTWQRPGDFISDTTSEHKVENLIVLCTASNQTSNETTATSGYVQGAADDAESWSMGLDAAMFWKHRETLISSLEDDLPEVISNLVKDQEKLHVASAPVLVKPTALLWIGTNSSIESLYADYDLIISCSNTPLLALMPPTSQVYMNLPCSHGKVGSRQLRAELPTIFASAKLFTSTTKVLITCDTSKDLAVGAALAILCSLFDDQGALVLDYVRSPPTISKSLIKQRLSWIMVSMPAASPSRATLQSVNAFLMS